MSESKKRRVVIVEADEYVDGQYKVVERVCLADNWIVVGGHLHVREGLDEVAVFAKGKWYTVKRESRVVK